MWWPIGFSEAQYDVGVDARLVNAGASQGGFIRVQGVVANERGGFSGVFGLVNRLAGDGRLGCEEDHFRRINNQWYDSAYPDPSDVDPTVYDHERNPYAAAWFKVTSTHLLQRVDGYLAILDRHGVGYEIKRTDHPGRIIYEDAYQVVAVPLRLER